MLRVQVTLLLIVLALATTGCGGGSSAGSVGSSQRADSLIAVQIAPDSATVLAGASQTFVATVTGTSNTAVDWKVAQSGGTITPQGVYTAPSDASGTFLVVAVSRADPLKSATATITVPAIDVSVSPVSATLRPGGTQTFTATVTGLSNTKVMWSVQEPGGGTVSSTGAYIAPSTPGIYHVVATSVAKAEAKSTATLTVTNSSASFTQTGDMHNGRGFHTATLLGNGTVLIAGGANPAQDPICVGGTGLAELYDPAAGTFTSTGSMRDVRYAHASVLLPNGAVLITGGFGTTRDCFDLGEPALQSADLYDSAAGVFQPTGKMVAGRGGHTATLLTNGKVLIVGGGQQGGGPFPFYDQALDSAELYDPATGVFTSTGTMEKPRFGHTATLLPDGTVLVTGGIDTTNPSSPAATTEAEIYNPATGAFIGTGRMTTSRAGHTATLLANGRVLIAGGLSGTPQTGQSLATAEVYDPLTHSFSRTGEMAVAHMAHTATLLGNGTVLITGGDGPVAEIYSPSSGSFSVTGGMKEPRVGHTATLLVNGSVLISGGGSISPLKTAELYK